MELNNHNIIGELHQFLAGNLKEFDANPDKFMRVKRCNPVLITVIAEDQFISERDKVDQTISEYSSKRRYD